MAGFTWVSVCFCFSPLSGAVTMFFFGSLRSEKIVVNLHPPKNVAHEKCHENHAGCIATSYARCDPRTLEKRKRYSPT